MALIGSLQFGDNVCQHYSHTYLITDVKCHTLRPHTKFAPCGPSICERLEIKVVAPGKKDLTLFNWYVSRSAMSGRVHIELSSDTDPNGMNDRVIYFENAVCFQLSEEYDIDNGLQRLISLSFQPENL